MSEVAGQFVLDFELFFLEAVEKVFVGVGPMLFLVDQRVERGVLRFQSLGHSLVHWCLSFPQSQCHGKRNKPRIVRFVLMHLTAGRRRRAIGRERCRWSRAASGMSNDNPAGDLEALKAEHRELDERIRALSSEPTGDQLEIARLKRRKLMLKDQIERIVDSNIPDIIA